MRPGSKLTEAQREQEVQLFEQGVKSRGVVYLAFEYVVRSLQPR